MRIDDDRCVRSRCGRSVSLALLLLATEAIARRAPAQPPPAQPAPAQPATPQPGAAPAGSSALPAPAQQAPVSQPGASPAAAQPAPPASPAGNTLVDIQTTDPHVALERRIGSLDSSPFAPGGGFSPGDTPPPGSAPPAYAPPSSYGPYWQADWERVCATPCLRPVAARGVYRIGGDGITPSSAFRIRGDRTVLKVSPGSASMRNLGTYMSVFGFVVAAAGGVFLAMSLTSHADTGQGANHVGGIISGIALGTGVVVGVTGLVLFAANGTTVRDERDREIGSRGDPTQGGARGRTALSRSAPVGVNAAVRF